MINWKVRLKNKAFWITMIPAIIILIQAICNVIGVSLDLAEVQGKIIAIIEAVFVVLAILGIVVDPTTDGISDSDQAMTYDEPKKDGESNA